jgi:hypothetical protein
LRITPRNIKFSRVQLSNKTRSETGDPIVIVRKITKEVVKKAIQAYAEDLAYYLKFYAAELDSKTLNVLEDHSIVRDKLLDDLLEKGESIDIENYNLSLNHY